MQVLNTLKLYYEGSKDSIDIVFRPHEVDDDKDKAIVKLYNDITDTGNSTGGFAIRNYIEENNLELVTIRVKNLNVIKLCRVMYE